MSKYVQPGDSILIKIPKLPSREEMMEWDKMETNAHDSGKFLDARIAKILPAGERP